MRGRGRGGRRVLGFSAVLAVAAAVAPAAQAVAQENGRIELTAWFDENGNQVRDQGEDPMVDHAFIAWGPNRSAHYPEPGTNWIDVPPGRYDVRSEGYDTTTVEQVTVTVEPGGRATAEFGLTERSVGGVVWEDTNVDGVRQDGEPTVPGIEVAARNGKAVSDDAGRYTVPHVASAGESLAFPGSLGADRRLPTPHDQHDGSMTFPGEINLGPDSPTDSDFQLGFDPDLPAQAYVPGSPEQPEVDLGLVPGPYDQSLRVRADRDISALPVGGEFVMEVTVRGESGTPASREIDVANGGTEHASTGLSIVGVDGGGWPVELAEPGGSQLATIRPAEALAPGAEHTVRVRVRAVSTPSFPGESEIYAHLNGQDASGVDSGRLEAGIVEG